MIREILVVTSTYAARPYTLLVVGEGGGGVGLGRGNQVSARRGKEYVIFSWREIVRCNCATGVFLGGKLCKKWHAHCGCVQKLVYFE